MTEQYNSYMNDMPQAKKNKTPKKPTPKPSQQTKPAPKKGNKKK